MPVQEHDCALSERSAELLVQFASADQQVGHASGFTNVKYRSGWRQKCAPLNTGCNAVWLMLNGMTVGEWLWITAETSGRAL
jgi:hypothetical protein